MGWMAWVQFSSGTRDLSLLKCPDMLWAQTCLLLLLSKEYCGGGYFPPPIPSQNAAYSPLPSAVVQNAGDIPPRPHTSSWRVAYLSNHKNSVSSYCTVYILSIVREFLVTVCIYTKTCSAFKECMECK
jgi:hypothetical protein